MVLVGGLYAGLAHAQDADVHWSVAVDLTEGVPVFSQRAPTQSFPIPMARSVPVHMPQGYQQPTRWDGVGIANRYDRRDNLRRDLDGDGVPNWRDSSAGGRR
ncbi:hypothetical protein [Azohydromonas aeria]|uniref:hypothetical protein n=1 Tax=Azohydromonas aeria TaxID=2590212 RepID=UPI0012F75AC7|nr:hypothetical protein [Azohydromonas aeria]